MTKFRILSDTHLEFYKHVRSLERYIQWSDEDKDSHLIVAGDIGLPLPRRKKKGPAPYRPHQHYVDFMKMLRSRFLSVTIITGNHEYYICQSHNISMERVDGKMREIAELSGVNFLQCSSIEIEGVTIHGATLFSNISPEHGFEMNDTIKIDSREVIVAKHFEHLKWLNSLTFGPRTIVVTHHVPTAGGHSGYYANVIDQVKQRGNIDFWICGHTHHNIDVTNNGTRVLSCCIGYPKELPKQEPLYFEI